MNCVKCDVKLALYGNYEKLRVCPDCGREYAILNNKLRCLTSAEFRRIIKMLDAAEKNKDKLSSLLSGS